MRRLGRLALVTGASIALAGLSRPSWSQAQETVEGSWRLVSAKVNGKVVDFPPGVTILKHVTATHFVFVHYDRQGQISVAGGGHYTLGGNRYEETLEYGLGEGIAPLIGKNHVFTLRIEGGRWYHGGQESDGTVIEEVWERIPGRG